MQRSILITGCSSGIGLACAREMKARGWRVFATARKRDDLDRLLVDEGVEALYLELADPSSVAACAERVISETDGKLYALFNNAAFSQAGAVEDVSSALLRNQFEINVIGAHELIRRVIPFMRINGGGRIVQCSSVLGLVTAPYRGAYCASKYALESLSDALRMELADTKIDVSLIEPGPIRSKFVETAVAAFKETIDIHGSVHSARYLERLAKMEAGGVDRFKLEPEAVAEKLVHAVESARPKPRYFVTKPTYIADALRRVLPTRALDRFLIKN